MNILLQKPRIIGQATIARSYTREDYQYEKEPNGKLLSEEQLKNVQGG